MKRKGLISLLSVIVTVCCMASAQGHEAVTGKASVYSDAYHGKKTATGEVYDKNGLTAASNHFPLGSRVHVRHMQNGKHVVVRINDIQAKSNKHVLDLSRGAAAKLGVSTGHVPVEAKLIDKKEKQP
jgi:rare lipoprotein A